MDLSHPHPLLLALAELSPSVRAQLAEMPAKDIARKLTRSLSAPLLGDALRNPALLTDSYKPSHFLQLPRDTRGVYAYLEARGGPTEKVIFFGLQMILKEWFSQPLTREDVAEAARFWTAHGEPFNRQGFLEIVERHGGFFPVTIKALPEGTAIAPGHPLVTVECTDPEAAWCVSFIETLLMQVWYPTTVATLSWSIKGLIQDYLEATSDDPDGQLPFKLHDFGFRGVSSVESAARGAAAHLVSFKGTDTAAGLVAARTYYHEPMAGFSIPAAEHGTITAWGQEGEEQAYRNMLASFGGPGKILAVVSDSYDLYHAIEHLWCGSLKQAVINSGATVVIRPDSGHPATVVLKAVQMLERGFGSTTNSKGYRVLNHVRVIQGDGINRGSIREILSTLKVNGYSADNIAFGMGGGLLQAPMRDDLGFAYKSSAILVPPGTWKGIGKNPATDPAKASKRGRVTTWLESKSGEFRVATLDAPPGEGWVEALVPVWRNGVLLVDQAFSAIRERAAQARCASDIPVHA